LAKGKWVLLGFFDGDAPSIAATGAWPRLVASIPKGALSAAVLTGTAVALPGRCFRDPVIARTWKAPGSPFYALIDRAGNIAWLWFGFTAEKEAEMRTQLAAALKGSGD
jgi:hypothetical protein